MRTCKFYSPGKMALARYPGAEMAEGYEFNAPFGHGSCSCPDVRGGAPFAVCNYEGDYGGCICYTPEAFRAIKSVIVTKEDAELPLLRYERITMESRREGYGVPEYRIIVEALIDTEKNEYGNPVVVHTIHPMDHGMKTKVIADKFFTSEVEEVRSKYPYEELSLEENKTPYITTVVTA